MPKPNPIARDPGPLQLTETQIDNYRVRPEFFTVRKYNDPITEHFDGQGSNDAEAAKKSMEKQNHGSVRAQGKVNHANQPSFQQAARDVEPEQD